MKVGRVVRGQCVDPGESTLWIQLAVGGVRVVNTPKQYPGS